MSSSNRYIPRRTNNLPWWLLTFALLLCTWLIVLFKLPGVLLSLGIMGLLMISTRRPDAIEIDALISSISLSAEDISDVIKEFDEFCQSPDAKHLEDRTLLRPSLLDRDSEVTAIMQFHEDYANAQRFLHRLPARLSGEMSVKQAERLLAITDDRAKILRQSWLDARQAARKLGPS